MADLLRSYSVSGIKVDLAALADGSGANLDKRIALFTETRDNRGTMVLGKDEEFFNVSTPLGTVDKLQAQAQEHCCSVTGIPLVVYTGITPSGLNASSEGEIEVWQDFIHAYQTFLFGPNLDRVLAFVQLSEFGDVDSDIGYEFIHLHSLSESERATVRKTNADTDEVLVRTKSISAEEARARVAHDAESPYAGLDLSKPVPSSASEQIDDGTKVAATVIAAHEAGLTSDAVALTGLAATGLMPEITPEVIAEADEDPPRPSELRGATDPVENPLESAERAGRLTFGRQNSKKDDAD